MEKDLREDDTSLTLEGTYSSGYASTYSSGYATSNTLALPMFVRHGIPVEDRNVILRNFRYLKDELDPDELVDMCLAEGLFDERDGEELAVMKARYQKVDMFLRKILRCKIPEAYVKLRMYLNELNLGYICERLSTYSLEECVPLSGLNETDIHVNLKHHQSALFEMIDPHKVAETLLIYGELSLDQYEEIIHQTLTRHKSCVALLNCIKNASDIAKTYSVLVKALEDDKYPIDFLKKRSSNRKGIDSLKTQTSFVQKHIKHTAGTEDKRTSSGCFEIAHETETVRMTINIENKHS